jgi:hypothetical protein
VAGFSVAERRQKKVIGEANNTSDFNDVAQLQQAAKIQPLSHYATL